MEDGDLSSVYEIHWTLLIRCGVCRIYDIFHAVDQHHVRECLFPDREVLFICLKGRNASVDADVTWLFSGHFAMIGFRRLHS